MLRSRQLDEFLNHISHSCCFIFCKSRTMLIKPWVFEEFFFFFLLLFKKLFWPSVSHRRTGMGGFLPSAPGHQSKYSSPAYNLSWPNYFPSFDWILHFLLFHPGSFDCNYLLQYSFIKASITTFSLKPLLITCSPIMMNS